MIDTDIKLQWHLDSLPAGSVDPLQGFFDRLPVDPYIEGRFRERRYGRVEKEGSRFIPSTTASSFRRPPSTSFWGTPRTYAELDPAFVAHPTFQLMLTRFARHTRLADGQAIGIHQMRIVTGEGESVPPAPEGVHQDGFDFIGVFFVAVTGQRRRLAALSWIKRTTIFSTTIKRWRVSDPG